MANEKLYVGALIFAAYYYFFASGPTAPTSRVSLADATSPANPTVYFDIKMDDQPVGRVTFELFANIVPLTADNFRALCTGEKGVGGSGKPMHYKGSIFHRVIPGFMLQGGDFTTGNGMGGESIYGSTFNDENFNLAHTEKYLLSMANRGRNTQGSQFFVTTAVTSHLDGKHVVFGRVKTGHDVIDTIESVGSRSGSTSRRVVIVDSGQL